MSLFNHRQNKMGPDPFSKGKWYRITGHLNEDESAYIVNDPHNVTQDSSMTEYAWPHVVFKQGYLPVFAVTRVVDPLNPSSGSTIAMIGEIFYRVKYNQSAYTVRVPTTDLASGFILDVFLIRE